jgi:pyroglutamyl-peptidase
MKVLLTGFGPFGTVVHNPSGAIVAYFEGTGLPGHSLTTRVFPVSFRQAGEQVASLLRAGAFEAALLLGVAQNDPQFRLERIGRNLCQARIPDSDGEQPRGDLLLPTAPESYSTVCDTESLCDLLTAGGFSTRLSDSAGGYVCNATYFAALHAIAVDSLPTRCLFLHVPPAPDTLEAAPSPFAVPIARQIEAVRLSLQHLTEA